MFLFFEPIRDSNNYILPHSAHMMYDTITIYLAANYIGRDEIYVLRPMRLLININFPAHRHLIRRAVRMTP